MNLFVIFLAGRSRLLVNDGMTLKKIALKQKWGDLGGDRGPG